MCREEAERRAAEERERAKRERRCPECGNKVRVVIDGSLFFVLCFFCCSLLQLNHNFLQTFGEDSEMLAEDLYYHRVVIIYAHFRNILVEGQVTNLLDLNVLLDACRLLTCLGLLKVPLKG